MSNPASASASTPLLPGVTPPPAVSADYLAADGAPAQPVRVLALNGQLLIQGAGADRSVALRGLRWPDRAARQGHLRELALPGGARLRAVDPTACAAWDAWQRQVGPGSGWRALRWAGLGALLAGLAAALLFWLAYAQGLPLAARGVLALIPAELEARIGRATLEGMDGEQLAPSTLPPERRRQLEARVAAAVQHSGAPLTYDLQWRRSRDGQHPGPNAFALPGGTVVVTDELVQLLDGADDALLGVIGHELGHVRERHGMRLVTQTGLVTLAVGALIGDYGSVLAGAPVLLAQGAYSRDFEREADDAAIALLRANGISPLALVMLFERLAARPGQADRAGAPDAWGIAFASHPPDAERVARIRAAAASAAHPPP